MRNDPFDLLAFGIGGTQGRCASVHCDPKITHGFELRTVKAFRRGRNELGPAWLETLIAGAKVMLDRGAAPALLAVSFGGPVRPDGGVQSTHVPGWENIDLAGELAGAFKLRREDVRIENDANAGAWGEYCCGAGRGCRDMLYFTLSTGIGGGVILDGRLRRGTHGLAGEFGHMLMDDDPGAPQYAAGKPGVLEALASGPAMEREGRAALLRAGRAVPETFGTKQIFDAAERGEEWALETRRKCVGALGRGIAAAMCAYDVERVIVGGGVALAGDALFVPLRAAVELSLPVFMARKLHVLPAELGDQAPLYGVVCACL
jgi:glucokinase